MSEPRPVPATIEKDSVAQASHCDLCNRRYLEGYKVTVAAMWILKTCRQCGQATHEQTERYEI